MMHTFHFRSFFIALLLTFGCFLFAHAQQGKGTTPGRKPQENAGKSRAVSDTSQTAIEQKAIRQQFEEFIHAYSTIEKTKDKQAVLKYVSKEVISTLVNFSISEKMNVIYSDYAGFAAYLDKLITTEGLEVDYKVSSIDKIYVHNKIGVLIYSVDYNIKKDGQSWTKGHESVEVTYKKIDNSWKIIQYTVTAIEDAKLKAPCECDIYGDDSGEYVVRVVIPNGRSYTTELNPVGFIEAGKSKIIAIGNHYYQWLENGDLYVKISGSPDIQPDDKKIGNTRNQDKTALLQWLLKTHMYADTCGELKMVK